MNRPPHTKPSQSKAPTSSTRFESPSQVRVLLCERQVLVRQGLSALLEQALRFRVVGEAESGRACIRKALLTRPDIVITELQLAELDGLSVAQTVLSTCPAIKIVVLTSCEDAHYALKARRLGIHGFAYKDTDITTFTTLLYKVLRGEQVWEIARIDSHSHRRDPTLPPFRLTVRDGEVLNLLALGHTNREIGTSLGVTEKTVRHYLTRIYAMLGVRNRTEAALYALSEPKQKASAEFDVASYPEQ